jgi:hypothetical protein
MSAEGFLGDFLSAMLGTPVREKGLEGPEDDCSGSGDGLQAWEARFEAGGGFKIAAE